MPSSLLHLLFMFIQQVCQSDLQLVACGMGNQLVLGSPAQWWSKKQPNLTIYLYHAPKAQYEGKTYKQIYHLRIIDQRYHLLLRRFFHSARSSCFFFTLSSSFRLEISLLHSLDASTIFTWFPICSPTMVDILSPHLRTAGILIAPCQLSQLKHCQQVSCARAFRGREGFSEVVLVLLVWLGLLLGCFYSGCPSGLQQISLYCVGVAVPVSSLTFWATRQKSTCPCEAISQKMTDPELGLPKRALLTWSQSKNLELTFLLTMKRATSGEQSFSFRLTRIASIASKRLYSSSLIVFFICTSLRPSLQSTMQLGSAFSRSPQAISHCWKKLRNTWAATWSLRLRLVIEQEYTEDWSLSVVPTSAIVKLFFIPREKETEASATLLPVQYSWLLGTTHSLFPDLAAICRATFPPAASRFWSRVLASTNCVRMRKFRVQQDLMGLQSAVLSLAASRKTIRVSFIFFPWQTFKTSSSLSLIGLLLSNLMKSGCSMVTPQTYPPCRMIPRHSWACDSDTLLEYANPQVSSQKFFTSRMCSLKSKEPSLVMGMMPLARMEGRGSLYPSIAAMLWI